MKPALILFLILLGAPVLAHAFGAPLTTNPPKPDLTCAGPGDSVGGRSGVIACCEGLVRLNVGVANPAHCDAPSVSAGSWVCAPCGNGVCEAVLGEDLCNCPADCGDPAPAR